MEDGIGAAIGMAIVVLLLVLTVGHCSKVQDECDRKGGVVVRNYYNLPECIEQGQR